jgi:hypothetical protein
MFSYFKLFPDELMNKGANNVTKRADPLWIVIFLNRETGFVKKSCGKWRALKDRMAFSKLRNGLNSLFSYVTEHFKT